MEKLYDYYERFVDERNEEMVDVYYNGDVRRMLWVNFVKEYM